MSREIMSILIRTALVLISGGVIVLANDDNVEASHNPPPATFAVDVNIDGNNYTRDPNSDGSPADNSLVVGTVDFCVQVPAPGPQTIDIVARSMRDVVGYDVRLKYDPSLAVITAAEHTPFPDPPSPAVGFINLPVESGKAHRGFIPANNIDDAAGSAFLATTYLGSRTAFSSPDHPHDPSAAEPYAANDPDGVTLLRLSVSLEPASSGAVVQFDLTNQPQPGNDYISLDTNTGDEEIIPVPDTNLIDGAIAVNTSCPAPPPGAGGGGPGPGQTPGPGGPGSSPPGSTPGGSPGGTGATGTSSPGSASASPTNRTASGKSDSGDDGGPLGTGSGSALPIILAIALLVLGAAAGAIWLWRRRFR